MQATNPNPFILGLSWTTLSYILLHLPRAHPLLITWLPISLRKLVQLEEKVCRLPPRNLPHSLPISLRTQPSSCYRDEPTVIIPPSLLHHHFLRFSGSFPSSFKLIIFHLIIKKKNLSWCYYPLQQEPHFSPSFLSKAFIRIFYTCKGLYCSSLLNLLLMFLPPWLQRIHSYQRQWWHPCHYAHGSILHVISLTYQQLWVHLITVPNSKSSSQLPLRTPPWPACLPTFLAVPSPFLCFFLSSLWPLHSGGN